MYIHWTRAAYVLYDVLYFFWLAANFREKKKNPLVAHFDNSYNLRWCFHYSVSHKKPQKD